MKLITLLGYFRLPHIVVYTACLKCVVSHYSALKVVTFILAMFSRVLKTHFPSRWNAFSCSFAYVLFACLCNSSYSHFLNTCITDSIATTEYLKSCSFDKEIMKAVWKYLNFHSYRNSFILLPYTVSALSVRNMILRCVLYYGPYNFKYFFFFFIN